MAFSRAMIAPIGTFELLVGLLADFAEYLFLLRRLVLLLILLDQVDLLILMHPLGGDEVTLLLLNIS